MISYFEFYTFTVEKDNSFKPTKEIDFEFKELFPKVEERGSVIRNNNLYVYTTVNFMEFAPDIKFIKNTPYIWKIVLKIPKDDILELKISSIKGFALFGGFIFLFLSITLWSVLKENTGRKFYEQKLEAQNQELLKNNRVKDKFISILAHDLKSPFAGVTGIFDILIKKYDTYNEEKRKMLIFSLSDSIHGINALLTNLLEWSKIQRGHIIYSPSNINLSSIAEKVYRVFKLNIESKNIEFLNEIPKDHYVFADKNMLEAILRNIISNAVKFTPSSGKIRIYSEIHGKYIRIYISDTGVGIDLETQSKLFKLDKHLTTLGTENEKGTGLGLVITKEFISLNGGKLEVDSTKGEGTTFIIILPKGEK
jgi:signal transduction histidine kinase